MANNNNNAVRRTTVLSSRAQTDDSSTTATTSVNTLVARRNIDSMRKVSRGKFLLLLTMALVLIL